MKAPGRKSKSSRPAERGEPSLQKAARGYLDRKTKREMTRLLGQKTRLWQAHKPVHYQRRSLPVPRPVAPAWTKQEEALLGTQPDEAIARRLTRTFDAVRYRRSQLGIPIFGGIGHQWTAAQDGLLRLHTTKGVARRLGISMTMVYWRRRKLGIAGLLPWKPKERALLGTMSDHDVARKLKRSLGAVRHHRIRRGIRAFGHTIRHSWTRAEEKLLGRYPDRELAKRLGVSPAAVQVRRCRLRIPKPQPLCWKWRREEDALLGTMPDEQAARRIGRTLGAVCQRRRQKGIGMFGFKLHDWTKAEDKLLGRCLDAEIAGRLDVTIGAVKTRRLKLSIRAPRGHGPWQPEEDALLGTMPDQGVARKLSRTVGSVVACRHVKRILLFGSRLLRSPSRPSP